ncbi:aldolase catalytic domain-containing protein [Mediterraneibacter sp. NSJ-55]|uniref:Aldolase catalytic domain-containing protein n=1 Tax=Mediterraneibacter hominis TaxID=2763054 RepID=A0A923LMA7_9FIRM|nr:aldolase catalytic domain-containing protein [Mediterraneibacter hominis]MBC5690627.1 aldolase catalytic domain-containing protein [Mediterraneibacter hominis]
MENLKIKSSFILDCTLRDGGYCNEWKFGKGNIKKIIGSLVSAKIDFIECGFLKNNFQYDDNATNFENIEQIIPYIGKKDNTKLYLAMVNYGQFDISTLPVYDGTSIDGIRVAFHKKDVKEAIEWCAQIKEKGYKVFIQPMVSMNYTDEEFLKLIHCANEVKPYAFYIVDSFGVMKKNNLIRLFYLVENNLDKDILIGYHAHNNMQLAYSNAQALLEVHSIHSLIIDSSVYGMGRGAGNLNTELITEYLNENFGKAYRLEPLLRIIDSVLSHFYRQTPWGYSLPNYLSAKHNSHPNYASYLDDRKTLTVENINDVFYLMDEEKKNNYDEKYIESLYFQYLDRKAGREGLFTLEYLLKGKEIVIIAPGKSVKEEKETVIEWAEKKEFVSISVNFAYEYYDTDFIFVSNVRRYKELDKKFKGKWIVTTNVECAESAIEVGYKNLLNETDCVRDNAVLMLIRLLIISKVKRIYIAGVDGYSMDKDSNYINPDMDNINSRKIYKAVNTGVLQVLKKYAKEVDLRFITNERYIPFSEINRGKNYE